MYPHERSLVKRMRGKPFALLGVNSDTDPKKLREVMKKEGITWRSFWDGGGTEGPIATRWNVSGWPTIYVIDHKGIIRAKQLRDSSLDHMVDKLVKEASAKAPPK
jgi:hypothetical protein